MKATQSHVESVMGMDAKGKEFTQEGLQGITEGLSFTEELALSARGGGTAGRKVPLYSGQPRRGTELYAFTKLQELHWNPV